MGYNAGGGAATVMAIDQSSPLKQKLSGYRHGSIPAAAQPITQLPILYFQHADL